tara:strand:- start:19617 stop:20495 length:879 start_codon:yes stop_codon:yes gene_type:complete
LKKLIRKILNEETPNFNKFELGVFKIIDKVGIEKFIDEYLRDMELDVEEEINLVWKYLKDYDGGCDEYINFVLEADEISNMFYDGDYDIQNMVKRFLEDDYDYMYNGYECYYDEYQLDDINEENMKIIIKIYESQKEEDETLREFIKNGDLESAIGCAYSDAQQNADINALHEDFLDGVHEVTDKIEGKWDWDTHTLKGRISVCEIMNHEDALEILSESLEHGYDWNEVVSTIVEREWEEVWNGDEGDVLFGEPVTIDEYRHFRYGGAGTIDKQEFNEYLYSRLHDEYRSFM